MDDVRRCLQCGEPMQNRKSTAIFHSQRCKRRWYRQAASSNYPEPPRPGTNVRTETHADARFRAAVASHQEASEPLTPEEEKLLALQRRNPGVLLVELQARMLAREFERQRAEAAELARHDPLRVQDQLDPSTRDHLRRRAIQSRSRQNKPQDPNIRALRPAPRHGPYPNAI